MEDINERRSDRDVSSDQLRRLKIALYQCAQAVGYKIGYLDSKLYKDISAEIRNTMEIAQSQSTYNLIHIIKQYTRYILGQYKEIEVAELLRVDNVNASMVHIEEEEKKEVEEEEEREDITDTIVNSEDN